ncbi:MAG: preprotein translocase subunit SecA [bacterium]
MNTFFEQLFERGTLNSFKKKLPAIQKAGLVYAGFSDTDFPEETNRLKARLAGGESLDAILPEAFALVREASTRVLGKRHYDVQLIAGMALHAGNIAEMRTGEGKTLMATAPAYLRALTGNGVHVVTVNDYLARRDATWMGAVYSFLGLSVGVLNGQQTSFVYDPTHEAEVEEKTDEGVFQVVKQLLRPVSRRDAYAADITYGTNSEFGFDYLRDNLVNSTQEIVQRGHYFAIIDEVDSILIDESRTPLIISNETADSESMYTSSRDAAAQLEKDIDYTVDEKMKAISLTDDGITKAERILGIENLYTQKGIAYVHHLETAVRARALYVKDKDYVVKDGEVVIVDPFTGRMQPGRRWSEGLHQAIEAKEGVRIEKETRSVASITYQNYFKFYTTLSGMTGTAKTSEEEFLKVYGLSVVSIPTHYPNKRTDNGDLIFTTEEAKFKAIATQVKELHAKGQPVLIGTVSIEKNELLSAYLKREGIPHQVLNAKNHEQEGSVIAQAGRKGSVVIATNMAGRGVDIILGGNPLIPEEHAFVKEVGGLAVIGTERHEARRIDNQLRGRAGRQGDPGVTQFFVSLEDDLMRIFGSDRIKGMLDKLGMPEDQPIQNGFVSRALESAQKKIEGFHFDARKYTLEYDTVLSFQRDVIYTRRKAMLHGDQGHIMAAFHALGNREEMDSLAQSRIALVGEDAFWDAVRRSILYVTDMLWVEHIDTMEHMRQSVGLRAYGQREPLVEYKKEATRLFREMEYRFTEQVLGLVNAIGEDVNKN